MSPIHHHLLELRIPTAAMYGGASKLGRGAHKRSSFPPPHRPSAPSSAGNRLSVGGSNRKTPPAVEESFNLVSGTVPPAFSMIIKLAPDLVDEIKRVEAQGGTARMKFDPNPNNCNGNVSCSFFSIPTYIACQSFEILILI